MRTRSLIGLALRGIWGSPLRSWLIGICALLIAGFVLSTSLIVHGAQQSLNLARDRLGADIIVVPRGAQTHVEGALLMGSPVKTFMPRDDVARIAAVPGVAAASPQLYLESLSNASCCSVSNMFMVAYDPSTDFTLEPWLKQRLGEGLSLGQAVGGRYVHVPIGDENIKLYGYILTLRGNLEPTGTNLDQTLFVTFETARDMARLSASEAVEPLVIPADGVSAVMVKAAPGADPDRVGAAIMRAVPGVTPLVGQEMFGAYRDQIGGLLRGMVVVVLLTIGLSLAVMALVFSMAVNERRRQIGVLRALGATRWAVLLSFLTEAVLLALAGGLAGVIAAVVGVSLFRALLVKALGFPFILPSLAPLGLVVGIGLALALAVVALAAVVPALRISRQEPALSMRE